MGYCTNQLVKRGIGFDSALAVLAFGATHDFLHRSALQALELGFHNYNRARVKWIQKEHSRHARIKAANSAEQFQFYQN